ncbi:MAG: hypothetical protein K0S34_815 [Bacillales bacterium]|jgi:hypothetical protein|nr:hypothetical protein [Bacillales bacterium]
MSDNIWYLEYEIQNNRLGLLGDISSLLGMLGINIMTINGVDNQYRGLLLRCENNNQMKRLESILQTMDNIKITKLRHANVRDRLAVRHGRYIHRIGDDKKTFRFVRDELGILVDFLAELFKEEGTNLIGIRGMPRVGKTESIVAASVCANKRWLFVSSTLIKQTIRSQLIAEEYNNDNIYIIDGIVSTRRANEKHWQLVREIISMPVTKVIEHPDQFVKHSEYSLDQFDCIIELRNDQNEEIIVEVSDSIDMGSEFGFSGFDF